MSGTQSGGQLAAKHNKATYGLDFYAVIGSFGGSRGRTGGFYANRELARVAGALGGRMGRRRKLTVVEKLQRKAAKERKEREAYFQKRLAEIKAKTRSRKAVMREASEMSQASILAKHGRARTW